MLYEPFMLNMVWKSTERFGNLSMEKYGILKWKMCRNPEQDKNIDEENHFEEKVKPAETLLSKWPKLPISPLSA